jgi:type IV secretory pathway TraG/TraD family ATPase VirD4
VRLFSIDGGHTEECTFNDICLAEGALDDRGVVILDDVFQPDWPGVISGLAKYVTARSALRPFAITPNKVYLARSQHIAFYHSEMNKRFKRRRSKSMFGAPVECYGEYERNSSVLGFARNKLREHSIGGYLWMVKRRLGGQSLADP